jgi:hypothetical protein
MPIPECPDCYLITQIPCEHRIRYFAAESFIRSQQVEGKMVAIVDVTDEPETKFWKGGKSDMENGPHIRLWPAAHTMYGWEMMTSVLIHEFGHLKLYERERIWKGEEAERKANVYGFFFMMYHVIPRHYWLHREFFLASYYAGDNWTEEDCRAEYQEWVTWMKASPTVGALNPI